jgi:hypothetical protein
MGMILTQPHSFSCSNLTAIVFASFVFEQGTYNNIISIFSLIRKCYHNFMQKIILFAKKQNFSKNKFITEKFSKGKIIVAKKSSKKLYIVLEEQ